MMHLLDYAAGFMLALCLGGVLYVALAIARLLQFGRRVERFASVRDSPAAASPAEQDIPAVSILKPLAGTERNLYELLRTYCVQDHPQIQMVFGVRDSDNPAIAVV